MRVSGNIRAIGYGFILGIMALAALILYIGTIPDYVDPNVIPELREQYAATCRITSARGAVSTGVLLNTGFILASCHGVDSNHNWIIDLNERKVRVRFEIKKGYIEVDGWVITGTNDYSIIQLDSLVKSEISVSKEKLKIGTPVYTFGYPLARGIHLTKGYQSSKAKLGDIERTSISVYMGNSGGGVFTKEGRTVGVIKSAGVDYETIYVNTRIPTMGGIVQVYGSGISMHVLSNWSEYVHTTFIYSDLMNKNLGYTLIPEAIEEIELSNAFEDIAVNAVQIWIVLMFIGWFRNELFK